MMNLPNREDRTMARNVTVHVRRTDEVNITECGLLTSLDDIITDEPLAMADRRRGVAIFPDVEWPAGTVQCRACVKAYEAQA